MLDSLITSKTRLKLLIKFFVSASSQGHLRGLADEFQESTNAIRKELNQLSEAGYLEKNTSKNKILYRANTSHSLFKPLQKLIHTYLGIDEIVEYILHKSGDIQEIGLLGDYAAGIDSEKIDLLILGQNINQAYLLQLADKVGKKLGKRVNLSFEKPVGENRYINLYTYNSNI